jgi:hypothetical protein
MKLVKRNKEKKMDNGQKLNRRFEVMAWGAFFIWWGITELVETLPDGTGAVGIGLILLGLNAVRSWNGVPFQRFTTTLGVLALVWGGLELAAILRCRSNCRYSILLIVLGVIFLGAN